MVLSRSAVALLLVVVLAGCGRGAAAEPENAQVAVGSDEVPLKPTQYCLDGDGKRYSTTPPILEVAPDAPITLTVPDSVAKHGWSVQVFDDKLEEQLGEVAVPAGTAVFDQITTSDVVPPAFYLALVEDKGGDCGSFTGAWPVGFIRAGT